jgi:ABC-type multidrug transport system fused ATPase/permease subunit
MRRNVKDAADLAAYAGWLQSLNWRYPGRIDPGCACLRRREGSCRRSDHRRLGGFLHLWNSRLRANHLGDGPLCAPPVRRCEHSAGARSLELEPTVRDSGPRRLESARLSEGLRIQNVSYSYGCKAALNDITLKIYAGECIAIIGPSGAGKSTLARLLVRAADPDSGSILLEGHPLTDYTTLRSAPER